MIRFDLLKVGDTVYWDSDITIRHGVVTAKGTAPGGRPVVSVTDELGNMTLVDDGVELFGTPRAAWLYRGVTLQNSAAEKLSLAAIAFRNAGIEPEPKPTPVEPVPKPERVPEP